MCPLHYTKKKFENHWKAKKINVVGNVVGRQKKLRLGMLKQNDGEKINLDFESLHSCCITLPLALLKKMVSLK